MKNKSKHKENPANDLINQSEKFGTKIKENDIIPNDISENIVTEDTNDRPKHIF